MTATSRASIEYVGHATVLVDLAGVRLLTDPLLRNRVTHLRRAAKVDPGALRGVDAVLISHLHYDHLDMPSLQRLGRELPVVAPKGAGALIKRKAGVTNVTEMRVGEEIQIIAESRSFLHHQVRNMVGTLKLVGEGKWTRDDVAQALAARNRSAAGPTAPAEGLYLMDVWY